MKKKVLTSAAAALLLWTIAQAADAPELREGLWSIHTQSTDNPGNKKSEWTRKICRSHAYDKSVEALSKNATKGCTKVSESAQGGKTSSELNCTVGGISIDTKGTGAYDGDTAVHSEIHTTYNPAFGGVRDNTTIADSKYLGACPAGVQPGDEINADGSVTRRKR